MTNNINSKANTAAQTIQNIGSSSPKAKADSKGGISFADTLSSQVETAATDFNKKEIAAGGKANIEMLKASTDIASKKSFLKFSNHALERMNTRGIHFTPAQITKIEQGMEKASQKGAKETLVLTDDSALIVSLKDNTVVTVMDKEMLRENVFTKIDSTVFV